MAAPKAPAFSIRDLGRNTLLAVGDLAAWAIGSDVLPAEVTAVTHDAAATDDMGRTSPRGVIIEAIVQRTTREGETYLKRQSFQVEHMFARQGEVPGFDDLSTEEKETKIAGQRTSYLASLQTAGVVASAENA